MAFHLGETERQILQCAHHTLENKKSARNQLGCEIIKRRRLIIILEMKIFPQGAMIMLRKGDVADRIYPDERSRLMRGAGGGGERHQTGVVKVNNKRNGGKQNFIETFVRLLSSV